MSFLSQPISLFLVKPKRQIGSIQVNVVMSETTSDKMEITRQPIQQGASITDHAYKLPTEFSMTAYFNANGGSVQLDKIYQNLLDLQNLRAPFDIITPKRVYKSMLFSALGQTTDARTENCLAVQMSFLQVILVEVTTGVVDRSKLKNPGSNAPTQAAGKNSIALDAVNAIKKAATGVIGR